MDSYRLGRLPARQDPRTLRFASFARGMAAPPATCNWTTHTPTWPVMLNDRIGDCTVAAAGHLVQEWTANALGTAGTVVSDADILAAYSAVSGYDPATGRGDNGAVMLDVLRYWSKSGIGGHKIHAYASVEPTNHVNVKQVAWAFGGSYIGLDLPVACQSLTDAGKPWDIPAGTRLTGQWAPGSWGGHAVPIVAYDATWLTVVTWGKLWSMSWRFFDAFCSEAWAVFSVADWLRATNGLAPSGFAHAELDAALGDVADQPPVIGPEPTPPTPPPAPTPTPTPGMSIDVRDLVVGTTHFSGTLYPAKP